jgi:hypothetical protein
MKRRRTSIDELEPFTGCNRSIDSDSEIKSLYKFCVVYKNPIKMKVKLAIDRVPTIYYDVKNALEKRKAGVSVNRLLLYSSRTGRKTCDPLLHWIAAQDMK